VSGPRERYRYESRVIGTNPIRGDMGATQKCVCIGHCTLRATMTTGTLNLARSDATLLTHSLALGSQPFSAASITLPTPSMLPESVTSASSMSTMASKLSRTSSTLGSPVVRS
jgi:hypothetical protein